MFPLTKIAAPTAAAICQEFAPQPAAQQLLTPRQTPAQYLEVLQKNNMSEDAVKVLAHGMPERESVWWATQSAQKVANPANPADEAAINAAQAWVKNPSSATQQAAAAAAAKTDFQTPGAWAAQAAAWSQPATPAAPAIPDVPATPRLAPHAVSGAVLLAAAAAAGKLPTAPKMPAPQLQAPVLQAPAIAAPSLQAPPMEAPALPQPELTAPERAQMAKATNPFIQLGMDIASGKNTWV